MVGLWGDAKYCTLVRERGEDWDEWRDDGQEESGGTVLSLFLLRSLSFSFPISSFSISLVLSWRLRLPSPSLRLFSTSSDLDSFTSTDLNFSCQVCPFDPCELEGGMDPAPLCPLFSPPPSP
ncbi:hypothetical protein FCM35_KLT20270 [Carex littledalei]|uniref:Uncharacterized protein n=1 Tax=Carex littledalei TaxID=544730 RepID=A0A833R9Z9_9POAL|nr:hypothetical protein FCM35_KLT20270 [Carex littledalei]